MNNPMKEQNTPAEIKFASEEAGAEWAKFKATYQDYADIYEIAGTGTEDGITVEDIENYSNLFPLFDSEDTAAYAIAAMDEHGIEFPRGEGSGDNGAFTVADIEAAIKGLTEDETAAVKFATSGAETYAKETGVDLSTVKGTGKNGGITKSDIDQALKALESKNDIEQAGAEPNQESDDVKDIIAAFVSFGPPVKQALKGRPKVQESWNNLQARAIKALRSM